MELWKNFDRLVVFDTETTGIEFGRDRIIEIGAVALENGAERGISMPLSAFRQDRCCRPSLRSLPALRTSSWTGKAWMTARRRRASADC